MEYTEKDLSQWFDLEKQKPWEPGVYEVKFRSALGSINIAKSYFDGEKFNFLAWKKYDFSADIAFKERKVHGGGFRVFAWRGLNHKPSAPKPPRKRKIMYVVVNVRTFRPCAAFDKVNDARDYAERVNFPVRVIRTRFRVPA